MKKTILSTIFILGTLIFAKAGDKMNFQSWDGNNDGIVDRNEFLVNAKNFDKWDENRDNKLSSDEFQKAFFKLFDNNGDDKIDQNEFQQVNMQNQANINMNVFDKDADMNISKDEFIANVSNLFNQWDGNSDNYISKNEFYDKVFGWWDADRDGNISKVEFDRVKNGMDQSFWDKIF